MVPSVLTLWSLVVGLRPADREELNLRIEESMNNLRRPAGKTARKTKNVLVENLKTRSKGLDESMTTNTNRREGTITDFLNANNDIIDKNEDKENYYIEDGNSEESGSDDEEIEDFYIASRKVTNQVEEERDSLKDELMMMRDERDSLKEDLKREKREQELMRFSITSIKKDRDRFKEELTAFMAFSLEREKETVADKANGPAAESSVKQPLRASSRRKSSVPKLSSSEDKVEDELKPTRRLATNELKVTKRKLEDDQLPHARQRKARSDLITESGPGEPVNTESVKLSCDECGQDFRRKEQLKRHMVMTHGA